jgi:hypothetical protein
MNNIEAILGQIRAIADRITGAEGYSLETLRSVSAELRSAADAIDAESVLRKPPFTDGAA